MRKRTFHFRPSDRRCRLAARVAVLAVAVSFGMAHAQDSNPGFDRPGLGFSPDVLEAGAVALEQGLPDFSEERDGSATTRLYSADTLLRLGLGRSAELQLGGSPWNRLEAPGDNAQGRGSSSLGLKFALPSSAPAWQWGLLAGATFTDGDPAIRAGARQYSLGVVVNWQVDPRQSLGLYVDGARGDGGGGGGGGILALSDTVALTGSLGAYAEVAFLQPGRGRIAGAGLAWMVTPRLQLDAGADRRMAGSAPDWQADLGASYYFDP